MRWLPIMTVAAALAFGGATSCVDAAAGQAPPSENQRDGGLRERAVVNSMLFESTQACRTDATCPSGVCYYGTCLGLLLVDHRWRQEQVIEVLLGYLKARPSARAWAVERLIGELLRKETDQGFRARALLGLEALRQPESIAVALADPNESMQAAASLALTRLGDERGVPMTLALTESDQPAIAIEAVLALGKSGRSEVLPALLRNLNPELDRMLLRATLMALEELADQRALRPLIGFLEEVPGFLRHRLVRVLRQLSGTKLDGRTESWRGWLAANPPPAPPAFELRKIGPDPELGLPEP